MSKKSVAERRQAVGPGGVRNGSTGGSGGRAPSRRNSRAQHRRPWGLYSAIAGVVAVFVIVVVVLEVTAQPATQDTQVLPAPPSVVAALTKVPQAALDTVGGGAANTPPHALSGSTKLTHNGKPEVLYIGGEYCPYCALLRWSLIGALSKFGTFSNLKIIRSSLTDSAGPNIPTFTFAHGVTYSSPYLSFVPREIFSNVPDASSVTGYAPFQTLTKEESSLFSSIGQDGFPFVDFGGVAAQVGSESTSPGPPALSNLSWQQVASDLSNLKSSQAQMILGGINYDTAAICKMTGGKPGKVCSQPVVQQLEGNL